MRVLIDADACPVVHQAELLAQKYHLELLLFCDTNHVLYSDYGQVFSIGAGPDAVDLALINHTQKGDLIITQDYGVASLALGKKAFCLHQNGKEYTSENIDGLLMDRHLAKKARRSHQKIHQKGPRKRTSEDDLKFISVMEAIVLRELSVHA